MPQTARSVAFSEERKGIHASNELHYFAPSMTPHLPNPTDLWTLARVNVLIALEWPSDWFGTTFFDHISSSTDLASDNRSDWP